MLRDFGSVGEAHAILEELRRGHRDVGSLAWPCLQHATQRWAFRGENEVQARITGRRRDAPTQDRAVAAAGSQPRLFGQEGQVQFGRESAVEAVLVDQPDRDRFAHRIAAETRCPRSGQREPGWRDALARQERQLRR